MTAVHLSANTIKATHAFVERVAAAYPTQQAILFAIHPPPAAQHCVRGHCTVNAQELMAKARFERHAYFVADGVDYTREKKMFNLAVGVEG